jgi:hypothetical protein
MSPNIRGFFFWTIIEWNHLGLIHCSKLLFVKIMFDKIEGGRGIRTSAVVIAMADF